MEHAILTLADAVILLIHYPAVALVVLDQRLKAADDSGDLYIRPPHIHHEVWDPRVGGRPCYCCSTSSTSSQVCIIVSGGMLWRVQRMPKVKLGLADVVQRNRRAGREGLNSAGG